jgi:hypothetical protein
MEALAQALVPALLPALLPALRRHGVAFTTNPMLAAVIGQEYDAAACATLAHELGNNPLIASEVFFGVLVKHGEVGATDLAEKLGVDRTPTIAFVLTTPLKRIATRLGLAWPFDVDEGTDGRTVWRDRDGIAAEMLAAIRKEKRQRGL